MPERPTGLPRVRRRTPQALSQGGRALAAQAPPAFYSLLWLQNKGDGRSRYQRDVLSLSSSSETPLAVPVQIAPRRARAGGVLSWKPSRVTSLAWTAVAAPARLSLRLPTQPPGLVTLSSGVATAYCAAKGRHDGHSTRAVMVIWTLRWRDVLPPCPILSLD